MEHSLRKDVQLGIFVTIGVALFVTGILLIGSSNKLFGTRFSIYVQFDDVEGLKKGDNVWFSGVKIGTVKDISFVGTSSVRVELGIEESSRPYIKQDARAMISSDGVLAGNKIVVITAGGVESAPVEDEQQIASFKLYDTGAIISTLRENNDNLLLITAELASILEKINKGNGTASLLLSDSTLPVVLRQTVGNLQQMSREGSLAARHLQQAAQRLQDPNGLLGKLSQDTSLLQQARQTMSRLEHAAANADTLTQNFQFMSEQLRQNNNLWQLVATDTAFARQLSNMVGQLDQSAEKLNVNMEAIRSNFLFRKYFKKKQKQEQQQQDK